MRKEALLFIRDLCNRAKMHYVVAYSVSSMIFCYYMH